MLHTKFRGNWSAVRVKILKGFAIYGHGGHLGHDQDATNQLSFPLREKPVLAHLSRRLKGELIVYRSIRRPCVRP